jgi:predicted NBD/HSP70 family sugar kinase/biotin operon repressor
VARTTGIGTSTDDVRRRNLSGVLTLVHRHRGLSRAELTRRTGLSRSTVKDLVAELAAAGLVVETQPAGANQVGRPSPMVRATGNVLAVAVNPDVDAVTVGLVGLGGEVTDVRRLPMGGRPSVEDTVAAVARTIDAYTAELAPQRRIVAVGVAVPGLVRGPDAMVRLAPHLDWHDEEVGRALGAATGLPVHAANDANLGAVAEQLFGGHPEAEYMIYVNGGAGGIGAGVVIGGRLLDGAAGYAGELGHTYVGGDVRCHCGATGCLETEVRQSQLDEPGDTAAVLARQAGYLGIALGNAINTLNPRLIVLGGFLQHLPDVAGELLAASIARHSMRAPRAMVRVVPARLGAEVLMIGAAELAFAPLLADPAARDHERVDGDGTGRRDDHRVGLRGVQDVTEFGSQPGERDDDVGECVDVDGRRASPAAQQPADPQAGQEPQGGFM